MKRLLLLPVLLSAVACGEERGMPTIIGPSQKLTVAAPTTVNPTPPPVSSAIRVASGPLAVPPDCLHGSVLRQQFGAVVEWRIVNVPIDAKVDKGYAQDDKPGCEATNLNLRTDNDHLRVSREGTTLIVRYDLSAASCHNQIDVSVDGLNVLGQVITETSCAPPPVVPPPTVVKWQTDVYCGGFVPENLTPANYPSYESRVLGWDGTDDSSEPFQGLLSTLVFTDKSCGTAKLDVTVVGNTATLDILTISDPATLSLVTYRKNGVTFLPQTFVDGKSQLFTAPGRYMMTVQVVQ